MKSKILITLVGTLFMSTAYSADISGKWKTVDDTTGYSRADVEMTKNADGTYSGKIVTIRPLPDKPLEPLCIHCKGALKNKPYLGMQIVSGFKQNPDNPFEYINGTVMDPLSGKVYKGKAKINAKNTRLSMRGYIGVSMLGRSVTWIRSQ